MLAMEELWFVAGGALTLLLALASWLLLRKGGKDYDLNRHENDAADFDLVQPQRELQQERARLEAERKIADKQGRDLAAQASADLARAAMEEGRELKELAAQSTLPQFEPAPAPRAISAEIEAQAQALIRKQQAEASAAIRRQEQEIERAREQQEREIERARAEYERARAAHLSLSVPHEPRPAEPGNARISPRQALVNTLQASYAQVAWAFEALARKLG